MSFRRSVLLPSFTLIVLSLDLAILTLAYELRYLSSSFGKVGSTTRSISSLLRPSIKNSLFVFDEAKQLTIIKMMDSKGGQNESPRGGSAENGKGNGNRQRRGNQGRAKSRTTLSHFQDKDFTKAKPNQGKNQNKPRNRPMSASEAKSKLNRYPLRPKGAPTVAIIGGGISGLVCARRLTAQGIQAVVYDTGKNEVGGRCSTRVFSKMEPPLIFDHSAQFFTVSDPSNPWGMLVREMIEAGAVREWGQGKVGDLENGSFHPRQDLSAFIGSNGMRSVAQYLASGSQIERPIWVSKMQRDTETGGWKLWHYQDFLGIYDYVVIAHNGKCAARLMSTAGKEYGRLNQILNVKFGASLKYPKPRYMQLCSLWVLLVRFTEEIPLPFNLEGAFIKESEELSWIANNSAKLGSSDVVGSCWTLISTPEFGQQYKCPQENIPAEHGAMVTDKMLRALETATQLETGTLQPDFSSVQLWGAANPISVVDSKESHPFIFQDPARVGICGDWLSNPSLEAAALSGWKLADHITTISAASEEIDGNIEMDCSFVPLQQGSSPLGQFTSSELQSLL